MTKGLQNFGLVTVLAEANHYVSGLFSPIPKTILQADGQWDKFLPTYEPQFGKGWDTYGCTVWGTENAIETLYKKIYGEDANFSERYLCNVVPINPPGDSPHTVAEFIREVGLIDHDLLPMTDTYEEFVMPRPMTQFFINLGGLFIARHTFLHEWVFTGSVGKDKRTALMKEHLMYSPLGVSVTAWFQGPNGMYVDNGQPNCHWCVCYGWNDYGWKIFDSYDQSTKIYSFDSDIVMCKRYYLGPVEPTVFESIIKAISGIFK